MIHSNTLIAPYGGQLVDLLVPEAEREALWEQASMLPSLQLTLRQTCDYELLVTGAFSPLDRFMNSADHARVVAEMRLADGRLFPMPIPLPVDPFEGLALDREIALRDDKNNLLAVMMVEEIASWDREEVSRHVFGTTDTYHPLVAEMARWGRFNLSGRIRALALPPHYDFRTLRRTPAQVREVLEARLTATGRQHVVAFQTRNPLHRAHEALTKRAAEQVDGVLLLHPSVGMTRPGDVDHFTRVRTYRALIDNHYEADRALLSLLPLAMRMGGPREAVWHALIRRNHGATHLIVGRDHAGPGNDSTGKPFYGPYAAQALVSEHAAELGITPVLFHEMTYLPDEERYEQTDRVPEGTRTATISGTQVRTEYLNRGRLLPDWFTRPEVAAILRDSYPARAQQGACVWFTGLSGSGKTTTAQILQVLLLEAGRRVTMLDGDVVRTHLSRGLGFSKEDRDANIRRIGFVAAELVKHGGLVICAAVSPYRATRDEVRAMMGTGDQFAEVFVDTTLEECERRDIKGMYAKARRGEISGFTGIDDPYEPPLLPEITLDTVGQTAEANARRIFAWLHEQGFIAE